MQCNPLKLRQSHSRKAFYQSEAKKIILISGKIFSPERINPSLIISTAKSSILTPARTSIQSDPVPSIHSLSVTCYSVSSHTYLQSTINLHFEKPKMVRINPLILSHQSKILEPNPNIFVLKDAAQSCIYE